MVDSPKQNQTPPKKGLDKTVFNKRQVVEGYAKAAGNVSFLCKQAGVSRGQYYQWLKDDLQFAEDIEHEKEGLIDFAESKLFGLIQAGNLGAICFFLKCKAKHRGYVERQEFGHDIGIRPDTELKIKVIHIKADEHGSGNSGK